MEKDIAVIGNFSLSMPGPNGSSASISGYLYADEGIASVNDRMDLCREALTRQQSILEIPILEETIKNLERQLKHSQEAYADLLTKKKNGKLASAERPHLTNYPIQIRSIEDEIAKGRRKIENTKAPAAVKAE